MPYIPAWSNNKGRTRELIPVCWCFKVYQFFFFLKSGFRPKAVLAFPLRKFFHSHYFVENEEALGCCSRVRKYMLLTCELAWAPLSLRNRKSKLHCLSSTHGAANPKTSLHVSWGEQVLPCRFVVCFSLFFLSGLSFMGKGKAWSSISEWKLYHISRHNTVSPLWSSPSFTLFPSSKTFCFWSGLLKLLLDSYSKSRITSVQTWSLDILPLRLYASN